MKEALLLAEKANSEGEIPVGAVIVAGNRMIGKGYNQTEKLNDATAHAELIALTSAFQFMGAKYLPECTLYVTLEPCPMCAGALHWSKIKKIIFGASDPVRGHSLYSDKKGKSLLHEATEVHGGGMEKKCGQLVEDFFKELREK